MFSCIQTPANNSIKSVTVQFMDKTQQIFNANIKHNGAILVNQICQYLDIPHSYHFGLSYINAHGKQRRINEDIPLKRQLKKITSPLYFKIRFYTPHLTYSLENKHVLNQFYLQALSDIRGGRLTIPSIDLPIVISYILQVQFGDCEELSGSDKIIDLQLGLLITTNPEVENKITQLYKAHKLMSTERAKFELMKCIMALPLFGTKLHKAVTEEGEKIQLGITANAEIIIVKNGAIVETMSTWPKIRHIKKFPWQKAIEYDLTVHYKNERIKTSSDTIYELIEQYKLLASLTSLGSGGCQR